MGEHDIIIVEQTPGRSSDSNLIEHFQEEIEVSGHRLKETKHNHVYQICKY